MDLNLCRACAMMSLVESCCPSAQAGRWGCWFFGNQRVSNDGVLPSKDGGELRSRHSHSPGITGTSEGSPDHWKKGGWKLSTHWKGVYPVAGCRNEFWAYSSQVRKLVGMSKGPQEVSNFHPSFFPSSCLSEGGIQTRSLRLHPGG